MCFILFCRTFANNQLQQKCYPCGIVDIVLNGNWRFEQAATTVCSEDLGYQCNVTAD